MNKKFNEHQQLLLSNIVLINDESVTNGLYDVDTSYAISENVNEVYPGLDLQDWGRIFSMNMQRSVDENLDLLGALKANTHTNNNNIKRDMFAILGSFLSCETLFLAASHSLASIAHIQFASLHRFMKWPFFSSRQTKTKKNAKRVKQIESIIRQRFNAAQIRIDRQYNKEKVEVVTADELSELADKRKYCDALLGWTLDMKDCNKFNYLTFDHIEPVTHVKHKNGSFGIGNIQPLCQILNFIKGSYPDKELCRWLILFLKACHRKYICTN